MRQRGRHRRRARGRALRAALAGAGLALTGAATLISTSQATVTDDPGALRPLTSAARLDPLRLTEQLVPERSLDRLAAAMGRPVDAGTVLTSTDRTLRAADGCTADEKRALPVEPAATRAYCWNTADSASRQWRPQSVTTSGDAADDGLWGTHRAILSGWSRHGDRATGGDLARVAFVNADDPDRLTYTWALLVIPVDGGRDYRGLASHVSGMVWYRDKLLVTASGDDGDALYVYDLRRVQRATVAGDEVGRVPGGWAAHGYRWVLPAVASYRPTRGSCAPADASASATGAEDRVDSADFASGSDANTAPCPNSLSVDRGSVPGSLVAGEAAPRGSGRRTLLWRYSFSADPARAGLLATDSAGTASAQEAYETKVDGVRGVLSRRTGAADGASWYLARAAGPDSAHGTLWRQDRRGAETTECGSSSDTHRCWGDGTGALSYWPQTDEVWSLSGRTLFAVPAPSVERALR
ncbi:hypothetical protein [Streptomyces sp. SID10815]|uniref:hypothetical protein n=1 Tax=Streptomyces sp. SID10815 TaxID=2706027 RepID=UPI0013CC52CA|nr:hypothetical protein [Streptomyces sp. SID10815]NEA48790.1 hypothetical protein [Streptomyces sp. SID10815]